MHGFLNLNKPIGFTSHDCVAKVRRLLKLKRVGHAGTLDPAASGVLPIALGRATRLLQFLRQDKAYRATIRLGVTTATDDLEGEILSAQPVPDLDLATTQAALPQFQGQIQQIPPHYSAIQVQGQRLYDLARAGKSITVEPRQVEVFQIDVLDWRPGEFPELDLTIACGPGTYIRAIARDLGQALGTGGTLAALARTASSGFDLADSLSLESLANQIQQGVFHPILPERALQHLSTIVLPESTAKRWCQGQRILLEPADAHWPDVPLRVHDEADRFLGIGQPQATEAGTSLLARMVFEGAEGSGTAETSGSAT